MPISASNLIVVNHVEGEPVLKKEIIESVLSREIVYVANHHELHRTSSKGQIEYSKYVFVYFFIEY